MKKGQTRQSIQVLGTGEVCRRCKQVTQRRGHRFLTEKQQQAPYHFSEWDVCLNYKCNMIQMYEQYKVWHKNDISTYLKSKEQERQLFEILKTEN